MITPHDPRAWDPFAPDEATARRQAEALHWQAEHMQRFQDYAAARQPPANAPVPTPLSPVAEATGTLGHCLALTEQLVLTLQDRLAPVLLHVPVSALGWNDLGLVGECPLTQDLTGHAAHLLAINTSLHRLVERLAL